MCKKDYKIRMYFPLHEAKETMRYIFPRNKIKPETHTHSTQTSITKTQQRQTNSF